MKFLNQVRHVLFAVMLIGLFASFAQNEYGVDLIYYSSFVIALIFWIDAFYYKSQNKRPLSIYLFSEHFWMGAFMMGSFFRHMHWPGAGPLMALGMLFLVIQYFLYGFRNLKRTIKTEKWRALFVFYFFLITIFAIAGFTFKFMHWPGANQMLLFSSISTITCLLFIAIRKWFFVKNQEETIIQSITLLRGKIIMVMCYFVFWSTYMMLSNFGFVPGLYTLSKPPAFEKLLSTGKEAEAGTYWDNYETFLDNRDNAGQTPTNIKITVNGTEIKREQ